MRCVYVRHHTKLTTTTTITMPATRRSTRSAAAAAAAGAKGGSGSKQSTLSFNNKVTKHNVAKATGKDHIAPSSSSASAAKPAGKKNAAAAAAADAVLTPPPTSPPTEKVEEEEEQDVQGSVVVEEEKVAAVQVEGLGGEKKKSAGEAEVEAEAEKVTEAQIKKFWREAEAARIAKRVHQQDLSVGEKVLRYFDISSQYGVSFFPPPSPLPQSFDLFSFSGMPNCITAGYKS